MTKTTTKSTSIREGADSVEAITSRTAATNESHAQDAQHSPRPIADIDLQITALQEERRLAARRIYPTFEEFALLPWFHSGAGVIRSASRACVVLIADADFAPDDWAEKNVGRDRLSRMVVNSVNNHEALLAAGRAVVDCWGVGGQLPIEAFNGFIDELSAAIAKAEGQP